MPRPRILVLNQYYAPGFESTAQLLTQLCEALAESYDVTVVTGVVDTVAPGQTIRNGVEVVRVASTAFERRRLALRAANYLTYVIASVWEGFAQRRPDLVVCMSDPPFIGSIARIVARRHRAPYVAIEQDVFPEIAVQLGRLENPVFVGMLRTLVGLGLTRADRVVAIGETMRRRLVEKGISPERIEVIPNWIDASEVVPQPKDNDWARLHDLADKFVVMHSGNVGYAQNLDVLIRAATFLRDLERLRIVIIGSGARKLELMKLAEVLEVESVVFMDYQERELLPLSLSAADLHFIGLTRGLAGYVVPSRMNGVLAAGRPVIVGADRDSEIVRVVETAQCGIVIQPGRPELLARAIRDAYEGEYDLAAMGERGRRYAESVIDRSIAIGRYQELVAELLA